MTNEHQNKYKVIKTQEQFFSEWDSETLEQISEEMKKKIYKRYFIKCSVFQRDSFECQNEECKTPNSKITLHHIKFQKNNGKDSLKNCITICNSCHTGYHRGKNSLTFCGMTYTIHMKEREFDWKKIGYDTRQMRKRHRDQYGIRVSWEIIEMLMRFLEIDYSTLFDEDEKDDD